jgi:hypothetical protein
MDERLFSESLGEGRALYVPALQQVALSMAETIEANHAVNMRILGRPQSRTSRTSRQVGAVRVWLLDNCGQLLGIFNIHKVPVRKLW